MLVYWIYITLFKMYDVFAGKGKLKWERDMPIKKTSKTV